VEIDFGGRNVVLLRRYKEFVALVEKVWFSALHFFSASVAA